ncbi:hypothetical protein POL68_07845 [Stigmatella sp. ncwal1]|uniref:Flagellar hook-length control protein-like C-terminal domain-containing protein n=1 Tax=Stigmatella ashevillensis TaxID=2995309 RepID=A0ABT5D7X1_9BACT|nr:hypothetical protein [Stigmatella ashevillena]MDC0708376.1 hypothetical protein [Stigmatella ashevillena]
MKIQGHPPAEPVKAPALGQFQRLLQQAKPPQASRLREALTPGVSRPPSLSPPHARTVVTASSPRGALARSALASPENLGQARQHMHGEAQRLRTVRTEAQAASQGQGEHRLHELLFRELAREPSPGPGAGLPPRAPLLPPEPSREPPAGEHLSGPEGLPRTSGEASVEAPEAPLQVQATLELIERIEVFVKSQRPALRMSLGGPLAATVEIERTGPREVALRIQGRQGPLAEEHLSRIREGLEARGLRLRALHTV